MTVVAVVGDGCTTTAIGLAAAWPVPCALVEFDPAGGSLAAWLNLSRSPGLADVVAASPRPTWADIGRAMRNSVSGLDVLVAPAGAVEAAAVVQAAATSVVPMLASIDVPVIADGGRMRGSVSPLALASAVVVIAHRQHTGSAAAAALGLERVAELSGSLATRSVPSVVALIGERPYASGEVAEFVRGEVVPIPVDPWAASVLAGRAASASRLRRSPLIRAMGDLARAVSPHLPVSPAPDPTHDLVEEWA